MHDFHLLHLFEVIHEVKFSLDVSTRALVHLAHRFACSQAQTARERTPWLLPLLQLLLGLFEECRWLGAATTLARDQAVLVRFEYLIDEKQGCGILQQARYDGMSCDVEKEGQPSERTC